VQLIFIEKRNFKTAFIIGIFFSRVNHLQSWGIDTVSFCHL
jgi:hypothetical protein